MCSTQIMSTVEAETDRRRFLRAIGAAAVGVGVTAVDPRVNAQNVRPVFAGRPFFFEKVIDCTQVLEPNIPNYFRLNMEITPLVTIPNNGVFVNRLTVPEHYGTHFDTPAHFIFGGATGESIKAEQLVGPLVIIDIAERASQDSNAEVTIADVKQWESRNGRIPTGAFVAMYSDWAARWPSAAYLNEDASGTYNFPGFGAEVAQFLVEERDIIGIGCDSHSLDVGPSTSFPAHIAILGAGKIGVEVLAGLDQVLRETARRKSRGDHPLIFIGGLRTRNGSGSPVRALVLV